MTVDEGRSLRPARSRARVLGLAELPAGVGGAGIQVALVEVVTETGRMHQVRVHLAAEGAPLVGDPAYGGPEARGVEFPLLHAAGLRFVHPATGRELDVQAPLPAPFRAVLDACRPPLGQALAALLSRALPGPEGTG
jgi:hypothetical protein